MNPFPTPRADRLEARSATHTPARRGVLSPCANADGALLRKGPCNKRTANPSATPHETSPRPGTEADG